MAKKVETLDNPKVNKFTKEQLLKSKLFSSKVDLLNALLTEDKEYTIEEANKMIKDFLEREVK